jgi:flagellar biosynthesis anti-sigma factor FlgM
MRIDSTLATLAISAVDVRDAKPSTSSTKTGDASSVVKLSSAATSIDGPSPTITARIAQIRSLLSNGEYPVDLDQLASRIVDDEFLRGPK